MNVHTRLAATVLLGLPLLARADLITWADPVNGSWRDTARWSTMHLPGASDDVLIDVEGTAFTIFNIGGDIRSLTLLSDVQLESEGLKISETLTSEGSGTQFLIGDWTVGGVQVRPDARLIWGQGVNATVNGVVRNSGALSLLGSTHGATPRPTFVHFKSGLENDGIFGIGSIPATGHVGEPAVARITGDLVNTGTIGSISISPGTIEVEQGRLHNLSDAEITLFGSETRVRAELTNSGRALIRSLGIEGANHTNEGSLYVIDSLTGDTLSNLPGGVFGLDPELGDFLVSGVDARSVAARNDGDWRSGGTFLSFEQSASGALSVTKRVPDRIPNQPFNPPLLRALETATLSGSLNIDFQPLPSTTSPLYPRVGDKFTLLEAGKIFGTFDQWMVSGLPSEFSASLVYTDTSVYLRVVPTPGSLACLAVSCLTSARRRTSRG